MSFLDIHIRLQRYKNATTNQRLLTSTIGRRLIEARRLADIGSCEAAAKMLNCDPNMLKNIENATDLDEIPLWLIERASGLYDVSVDYLFGLSDEWERSPEACWERDFHQYVLAAMERRALDDASMLVRLRKKIYATDSAVSDLAELAGKLAEAINTFRQMNEDFDRLRGGNSMLTYAEKINESSNMAIAQMKAFRQYCEGTKYEKALLGTEGKTNG